ncbi:hypothetical protein PILCRDRAFT_78636, partial [Piloderma croceum F 1598]
GAMESTMLNMFIKAGKLKCWLARPDCPAVIKECKILFDKAYAPNIPDYNDINDAPCTVPNELHPLAQKLKAIMHARLQHNGVIYTDSSTHLGSSLIHFYTNGDRSKSPTPGCIKYIFEHQGEMVFAVQRQLDAHPNVVDPFEPYPHFAAKLYSSHLSLTLELVCVSWVMCHFAQWQISSEHVIVLLLSQVRPSTFSESYFANQMIGLILLSCSLSQLPCRYVQNMILSLDNHLDMQNTIYLSTLLYGQ